MSELKCPRYPCSVCRRGTTKKAFEAHGRCPRCQRIWAMPSLEEAASKLSREQLRQVVGLWWEHGYLWRVAKGMKQVDVGRPWDVGLAAVALARAEDEQVRPQIKKGRLMT
jgi:hypothetical protein